MTDPIDPYESPIAREVWKELSASAKPLFDFEVAASLNIDLKLVGAVMYGMYHYGLIGKDKAGAYWPVDDSWIGDTPASVV